MPNPATTTLFQIIEGAIHADDFEDDPYSAAITVVVSTLDWALNYEIVGGMNNLEANILRAAERVIRTLDPDIATDITP